jgi:hypothetical protein
MTMNVGNGQFEFVTSDCTRTMLTTAHKAISLLELWEFVKRDPGPGGFMFSDHRETDMIYEKVEELGYTGHSGASFGSTLRTMQYIAKQGYDQFKDEWLKAR